MEHLDHECLNLAAPWRLRIVFVRGHDGRAEMTPASIQDPPRQPWRCQVVRGLSAVYHVT